MHVKYLHSALKQHVIILSDLSMYSQVHKHLGIDNVIAILDVYYTI